MRMRAITALIDLYYRGLNKFSPAIQLARCVCCGWAGRRFLDLDCGYGHIYRNSTCPKCQSQPRHRSMYLYLKDLLDEEKKIELLHFAPEKVLTKFLKAYPNIEYLSVDLDPKKGDEGRGY